MMPSMNDWIKEAKADENASRCGMYLFHNGVVRATAKKQVREGIESPEVKNVLIGCDKEKVDAAIENAKKLPGIYYVRVWLNEGMLNVGDDIMLVLVGGDIRPHVIDGLQALVGELKTNCILEKEFNA